MPLWWKAMTHGHGVLIVAKQSWALDGLDLTLLPCWGTRSGVHNGSTLQHALYSPPGGQSGCRPLPPLAGGEPAQPSTQMFPGPTWAGSLLSTEYGCNRTIWSASIPLSKIQARQSQQQCLRYVTTTMGRLKAFADQPGASACC